MVFKHMKCRGFFKLILGFILGFCVNFLMTLYQEINSIENCDVELICAKCQRNSIQNSNEDNLGSDFDLQLPESYRPKTMYDVLRYDYMNLKHVFGNFDDEPKIGLQGHHKNDLKDILFQSLTLLKHKTAGDWKLKKVVQAYRRIDPQRGVEYSLTLNLSKTMKLETERQSLSESSDLYQLDVVKPFSPAQLLQHRVMDRQKNIYLLLPVFQAIEKFQTFLDNLENVCFQNSESPCQIVLVVISFMTDRDAVQDSIRDKVQAKSNKYGSRYFRYIRTWHPFSRGFALDLATKEMPNDKLLFFCDTDVTFTRDFLDRCRTNAIFNKQVFYPAVFAQYNPLIVNAYSPASEKVNLDDINKSTGHWVHYGFGMACLYTQDYRSVGGFNLKLKGWGGEDVDLYKRHVRSELKVFRAMDPGLIHLYHHKSCDSSQLTSDQLRMCMDSFAQGYGSRSQMAKHVLQHNCSVDQIITRGIRPL